MLLLCVSITFGAEVVSEVDVELCRFLADVYKDKEDVEDAGDVEDSVADANKDAKGVKDAEDAVVDADAVFSCVLIRSVDLLT